MGTCTTRTTLRKGLHRWCWICPQCPDRAVTNEVLADSGDIGLFLSGTHPDHLPDPDDVKRRTLSADVRLIARASLELRGAACTSKELDKMHRDATGEDLKQKGARSSVKKLQRMVVAARCHDERKRSKEEEAQMAAAEPSGEIH